MRKQLKADIYGERVPLDLSRLRELARVNPQEADEIWRNYNKGARRSYEEDLD
jgi:hypothetical protein